MSKVLNQQEIIRVGVVKNDQGTPIANFTSATIDIGDIKEFGNKNVITSGLF